jgi:hypothetical protein
VPTDGSGSGDIREFEQQNGWILFLLMLVTCGFYSPFWMVRVANVVNRVIPDSPIPLAMPWVYFGLLIVNILLSSANGAISVLMPSMHDTFNILTTGFSYAVLAYDIFLRFRYRAALNDILNRTSPNLRRFGGLGTFFFGPLYLQIRLNQRIDDRNAEVYAPR